MAFQSEFADDAKLNACAVNDLDHIGEQFAPKGPWVVLIKKALNAWAAKQRPPVAQVTLIDRFGKETGDLVAIYKSRQTPPILNFAGRIDRIVGKKTVVALDKELPRRGGGGSSISPDMQIANAADLRRLSALMKADLEIERLKREFEPDVPDVNDPVVKALQRQLFMPLDGNFWNTTNQFLSVIRTNRLTRAPFKIDKTKPEFAHVEPSLDPGSGVTLCASFFAATTNDNCRHEVVAHEFFHFIVGAQHFYSTRSHSEAMRCPHHLARAVFDIALGQQRAPCSGSDTQCR
jgi:hypothetical protein